jgi:GGDEF domain-containing protein
MSEIAPWLVVGGAALVIVCVGITLGVLLRMLRRGTGRPGPVPAALSTLMEAAAEASFEDDKVMPLLLSAAIEVARADAAVVTFVRAGDRRRSYSADLDVREARTAIDSLGALSAAEPTYQHDAGALHEALVVPIAWPDAAGALAVYWRNERPPGVLTAELHELVATAFRGIPRPVETPAREPSFAPRDDDEHRRWSRLADLTRTLEPVPLLQKIVVATLNDCDADAAAARIGPLPEQEPITEVRHFGEHERPWAESMVAAETVLPSITRYVDPRRGQFAGLEASIATTIVVPLRDPDDNPIGNLLAVWRRDLGEEGDMKVADLELLVEDARAALGNATRFQQLQSMAIRDPSTGLFDQRHFFDLLARAVDAARWTSQPLTLLLLAASEVEPGPDDVRVTSLEQALVTGSARIARAVGELGVACRVGLGEFAAIMPNADLESAQPCLDALMQELPVQAAGEARLRWSASAVQLDDAEVAEELWRRARRELRPEHVPAAPTRARPATAPATSGTIRLSIGGEDWTLRPRAPREDPPD